jgi:HD-like signal output (HDOD) protein
MLLSWQRSLEDVKWGGPPGPRATPSSAWSGNRRRPKSRSRGTRADQGVRPTWRLHQLGGPQAHGRLPCGRGSVRPRPPTAFWHRKPGVANLGSVDVPHSIQRIAPLPGTALALLNRIPPRPGEVEQLKILFDKEPLLVNAISQVAVASGKFDAAAPAVFGALLQKVGAAELMEIAITLLVREYLQRALSVAEDERYWRYTLACAVCCEEIALPGEDNRIFGYVAGLLHDIGRLALIAAYPDKYGNLMTLIDRMFRENPFFDLLSHEKMLFGMDHFATGSWLASKWELPLWLRAITGKFNEASSGEYRPLVINIRSGTRLAHSLGFGYLESAPRAEIRDILGQLPGAWERWQSMDQWKLGQEHMRGKIEAKLNLYALSIPETD